MLPLAVSTRIITFLVGEKKKKILVGEHPNITWYNYVLTIYVNIMISYDIHIIWYLLCWSDVEIRIEFHYRRGTAESTDVTQARKKMFRFSGGNETLPEPW